MDIKEVLKLADELVWAQTNKHLNDLQEKILRGTWEDKDYQEIAQAVNLSEARVREVASELWQIISQRLGEKVSKSNLRSAMERWQIALFSNVAQGSVQNSSVNFCGENRHSLNITNSHPPQQEPSSPQQTPTLTQDLSEMPELRVFYGRTGELETLQTWILQERCRLVALTGISGIGKTALAAQLTQQIKNQFQYVLWRNLNSSPTPAELQENLTEFFSEPQDSNPSATNTRRLPLIKYLDKHRCLVILNEIHNLFSSGQHAGQYKPACEEYRSLFKEIAELSHNSCFLLVGWEPPREVAQLKSPNSPIRTLTLTGLDTAASRQILRDSGLTEEQEWDALTDRYQGNPFWLKSVATLIEESESRVTDFLQNDSIVLPEDVKDVCRLQFNRLSDIEKSVMFVLAGASGPLCRDSLLEKGRIPSSELPNALQSLSRRCLIEKRDNLYTLLPVLKQYIKGL
ncbi:MAG: AAA family ATPase [Oscillatoria sp. Prado101]|jgi:tetrahydromethanopterin S-methyltransferase subunit G|nr:AAA family ATPase [Oscillatoria sp. Prado101]